MQKNRCPFFFFEGLVVSLLTLSLSDPSRSSSCAISTSWVESTECIDLCELCLLISPFWLAGLLVSLEGVKGDEGRGRCPPSPPPKLLRVGVFAEGSSARGSSAGWGSELKKPELGRGVVGVVSSPDRAGGGSGTVRVVFTAWKADMVGCGQCRGSSMASPVRGVVFGEAATRGLESWTT